MRAGEGVGAITDEAARKADDESGAFSVAELRRQLSGEEPRQNCRSILHFVFC